MTLSRFALAVALATAPSAAMAQAADPATDPSLTDIVVVAPRTAPATPTEDSVDTRRVEVTGPDGAAVAARLPGAALIGNGAISGQLQQRGLFGERILIRIDDQRFATGGPNAMDPAFHYAPALLIDHIASARGASPVRDGPGFGGAVNATLKTTPFGHGADLSPHIDVAAQYRSADDSRAIGGTAGIATDRLRFGVIAGWEQGDDYRIPGGRALATRYDRMVLGAHAGWRTDAGELALDYRRQKTDPSGNPPFAMDIIWFHTDFFQARYHGELSDNLKLEARVGAALVDHRMNNFIVRPAPTDLTRWRQSDTFADTMTGDVALVWGSDDRHVRVGIDGETIDKGVAISNPNDAGFVIHSLDRAQSRRLGLHAEWRGGAGPVEVEAGVRWDRHRAETAVPRLGATVPMGPRNLATAFAARDRDWSGDTVDAVVRLWADTGALTPRLTLAHKTRAPSLIERFSWLPTEASGGLADGNIYVGDVALRPEKAWLVEAGIDWASDRAYLRPALFYRRINDYIQGVPFDATPGVINTPVEMVSAASGDATPLRFANVDAELYGADMAFGAVLAGDLRLDGVASVVRGQRRDIADNLYRIAPANMRARLAWDSAAWSIGLDLSAAARQRRVSATNGEVASPGWALLGASGHVALGDHLRLDAAVENLFDRRVYDHLAGINRIAGSDVAVGAKLPMPGRSVFVRLRWTL